jgi:hypothetical protein
MARTDSTPVSARLGGFVARHPKLVAALVASLLFLAMQDGAVAVDTTAEGAAYLGPDPDSD